MQFSCPSESGTAFRIPIDGGRLYRHINPWAFRNRTTLFWSRSGFGGGGCAFFAAAAASKAIFLIWIGTIVAGKRIEADLQ